MPLHLVPISSGGKDDNTPYVQESTSIHITIPALQHTPHCHETELGGLEIYI